MRHSTLLFAALAVFAFVPRPAAATQEDQQFWFQAVGQGSIKDDLVYFAEIQSRFGRDMSGLDQMLIRPAIGVKLSNRIAVYQGYAHVRTPLANGGESEEHRSFQQLNWSLGTIAGGPITARTRLEQRFLSTGDDTGWRGRQMLRLAIPIAPGKSPIAALGWVEGFVHFNDTDWGARRGLDRVRTFIGAEMPVAGKSTVELGYLNQYVKNRGRADDMDHILSVSLQLRH